MTELQELIKAEKAAQAALVLAHYYQTMDIQEIADHVCDSFEMARLARSAGEELLIICGVRFMAESAKILNPGKKVLMPTAGAGCPMADMISPEDVVALRSKYPDAAVVCYVNSSAAVKAVSDICCTSSSAEKVVRSLPEKRIVFIPDRNLGAFVAAKVPEKEIIMHSGYCPVHDRVGEMDVMNAKIKHEGAKLLVHPECREEVLRHADHIGSTAEIIQTALSSDAREFIIGTEAEVAERLSNLAPEKAFYPLTDDFICGDMKTITLPDVLRCLREGVVEIKLDTEVIEAARKSLDRMIDAGRA